MDQNHPEQLKVVLEGNGEFTKNLYAVLAKRPGNVFFSPISIHALLSLAYQGASGRTQAAFAKTLNVPDVETAALGYKDVMSYLNSVSGVKLLMASKVFLGDSHKLQEDFKSIAERQFSSEVELLSFSSVEVAASTINTWVENKTNNKIKNIINPMDLTDDTALVLVNVIYFNGKWAHPFYHLNTQTEKFYLNGVNTVDVQMMHLTEDFLYKEDANLDAKVLEMPYTNMNISLVIVLPNERNGVAELEQKLSGVDFTKVTDNMQKAEVEVSLPKFRIEQTIDLNKPLTDLGLGVIFGDDAEFKGITKSSKDLYVSKAVQKAFIEVKEEGTEAAAATAGILVDCCAFIPLIPPKEFIADHPFFIILRSRQQNTTNILFVGRISKPKY